MQTQLSPSSSPVEEPAELERFADRFELLEETFIGQMGSIYRAADRIYGETLRSLTVSVALRIFPRDYPALEDLTAQVKRAATLSHPNILRIFEFIDTGHDSGLTFENVEGVALSRRLQRRKIKLPQRISLLRQLAEALEYLHSNGIFFGDLNADEIIVSSRGELKLVPLPALHMPEAAAPSPLQDIHAVGAIAYALSSGSKARKFLSLITKNRVAEELRRIANEALAETGHGRISSMRALLRELKALEALCGAEIEPDSTVVALRRENPEITRTRQNANLFIFMLTGYLGTMLLALYFCTPLFASFIR